jgi:hypothetical protein
LMGRRRKSNKHLPQRVYLHHGRYWFMERDGKRRDLGTTEAEMYSKLAELADTRKTLHTMSQVFDRYLNEVLVNLAPRTQQDYRGYIENLRRSFGEAPPQEVTASGISITERHAQSSPWFRRTAKCHVCQRSSATPSVGTRLTEIHVTS